MASLSSFVGVDGTNQTLNTGRFLIALKDRDTGRAGVTAVIARLGQAAAGVPGIALFMQPSQDLTIDTSVGATQYRFILESPDVGAFATWVPQLVAKLQARPELRDVTSDLSENGLTADITIDRSMASRFGITPASVDNALYDAFGQRIVSTIFTQSNQYRVILEADNSLQGAVRSLGDIYLPSSTSTDGKVALSTIATIAEHRSPLVVSHLGQFPATTVSFNTAPGVSLGEAVAAVRATEATLALPASLVTRFQGAASAFENSLGNEQMLVLAAIVVMYIVLGVLYESFVHPITILSTLPSAGLGALVALMIAGKDLDIIGIIGIVLLIGIVKKNAIMMIDFALHAERVEGKTPREAIHQACLLRFRPILMTTLAALFAALPLMLGHGTGSELREPLGIAIVGGLTVSQVLTLFTTPVIYLFFDKLAAACGFVRPKGMRPSRSPCGRERFGAVRPPQGRHDPAHRRHRAPGAAGLSRASGGAAAAGRLPHHPPCRANCPARARIPVSPPAWPARSKSTSAQIAGITEMTSSSTLGLTRIVATIRSEPEHRRRGARRRSRHQRGPRRPADEPSAPTRPISKINPADSRR